MCRPVPVCKRRVLDNNKSEFPYTGTLKCPNKSLKNLIVHVKYNIKFGICSCLHYVPVCLIFLSMLYFDVILVSVIVSCVVTLMCLIAILIAVIMRKKRKRYVTYDVRKKYIDDFEMKEPLNHNMETYSPASPLPKKDIHIATWDEFSMVSATLGRKLEGEIKFMSIYIKMQF